MIHHNEDDGMMIHHDEDDGMMIHHDEDDGMIIHHDEDDVMIMHHDVDVGMMIHHDEDDGMMKQHDEDDGMMMHPTLVTEKWLLCPGYRGNQWTEYHGFNDQYYCLFIFVLMIGSAIICINYQTKKHL